MGNRTFRTKILVITILWLCSCSQKEINKCKEVFSASGPIASSSFSERGTVGTLTRSLILTGMLSSFISPSYSTSVFCPNETLIWETSDLALFKIDDFYQANDDLGFSKVITPSATLLLSGDHLVSWREDDRISYKTFDRCGANTSSVFLIEDPDDMTLIDPDVDTFANGDWLIVYSKEEVGFISRVGRIFDESLDEVQPEFIVSSPSSGLNDIKVSILQNQNFIATWGLSDRAVVQPMNNTGGRIGSEFDANLFPTGTSFPYPNVVTLSNGQYVVIWATDSDILGQIYEEDTTPFGSNFQINSVFNILSVGSSPYARASELPDGKFVVVWPSQLDVIGRIIDVHKLVLGTEFIINNSTLSLEPYAIDVDSFPNGDFVVVWEDAPLIRGQLLDMDGNKIGDEFNVTINAVREEEEFISVLTLYNGSFVVNWDHINLGSGTQSGVFGQILQIRNITLQPTVYPTLDPTVIPTLAPTLPKCEGCLVELAAINSTNSTLSLKLLTINEDPNCFDPNTIQNIIFERPKCDFDSKVMVSSNCISTDFEDGICSDLDISNSTDREKVSIRAVGCDLDEILLNITITNTLLDPGGRIIIGESDIPCETCNITSQFKCRPKKICECLTSFPYQTSEEKGISYILEQSNECFDLSSAKHLTIELPECLDENNVIVDSTCSVADPSPIQFCNISDTIGANFTNPLSISLEGCPPGLFEVNISTSAELIGFENDTLTTIEQSTLGESTYKECDRCEGFYGFKCLSLSPTNAPTAAPSLSPSLHPTYSPSLAPSISPTLAPSLYPTNVPSSAPSTAPSITPTDSPSTYPTGDPTSATSSPSTAPTLAPSYSPSNSPTYSPTLAPTDSPTMSPTNAPTISPTMPPTNAPTTVTVSPTDSPTMAPSNAPSIAPTYPPSRSPSQSPTPSTVSPTLSPSIALSSSPIGDSSDSEDGLSVAEALAIWIPITVVGILLIAISAFLIARRIYRLRYLRRGVLILYNNE